MFHPLCAACRNPRSSDSSPSSNPSSAINGSQGQADLLAQLGSRSLSPSSTWVPGRPSSAVSSTRRRLADLSSVYLSGRRIVVEHAFGRIKGFFRFLGQVPGYLLDDIWRMIGALLVLHNLLMTFGDEVGGMDGWEGDEEPVGVWSFQRCRGRYWRSRRRQLKGGTGTPVGGTRRGRRFERPFWTTSFRPGSFASLLLHPFPYFKSTKKGICI